MPKFLAMDGHAYDRFPKKKEASVKDNIQEHSSYEKC